MGPKAKKTLVPSPDLVLIIAIGQNMPGLITLKKLLTNFTD